MNNKTLFLIWGGLFILCAFLGFIPTVSGFARVLLILASVVFFVPSWILFFRGKQKKDCDLLALLLGISIASLVMTLVLLVLVIITAGSNPAASDFLYRILSIFSVPMFSSQIWFISLFLWACLLVASLSAIRQIKKQLS